MIFYKSVASGNDFLHVDTREFQAYVKAITANAGVTPGKGSLVERLCRRHTGAGADGLVYYTITPSAVKFEIFNQDGNEAELSGNGMGGLAALMFYLELFLDRVTLDTRVGRRTHTLLSRHGNCFRINIEIGPPDFAATHFFPFLEKDKDKYKLEYQYNGLTFYPVSVGNPHVVVIPAKHMEDNELEMLGRQLESAEIFPHKTNVEFVMAAGQGPVCYETGANVRLFFYERGVGRTLASSTGSAAVFAVLQKLGKLTDRLIITGQNQGEKVIISGKENIYIENSVEIVYKGVLEI